MLKKDRRFFLFFHSDFARFREAISLVVEIIEKSRISRPRVL